MSELLRTSDIDAQVRDIGEAVLPVVDEAARAEQLRREGRTVVRHEGRWWQSIRRGFYRPVHPLARFSAAEATRPALACWGYTACLADDDVEHANAVTPMHLVTELESFDEARLTSDRRRRLRKARSLTRLVELTGPALLRDQGYEVLRSFHERTGYGVLPTEERYLAGLQHFGAPAQGIVLAGLVDGRLAGYLTGYAIGSTAYAKDIYVASWAMNYHLSAGLTYEFLYACRRAGTITEMQHGSHVPENEGLCQNKALVGLPVVNVPSRLVMLPGAAALARRFTPNHYYRITGRLVA